MKNGKAIKFGKEIRDEPSKRGFLLIFFNGLAGSYSVIAFLHEN